MGYNLITIYPISWKPKVLPWGKFKYQTLQMGSCNSSDIFQEKVNELFNGLEYVSAYIDDHIIISNSN